MANANQEKYLGDIVTSTGKIKHTIEYRKNRACAIDAKILVIIADVPLGKYKIEIGLKLRQAMLLNGVLFNSESWHGVTDNDMKTLESIDEQLLRSLVSAQAKTAL